MPGLFFTPDRATRLVEITGSFEVDADVPDSIVRNRIFPEKARAFVEQMGKRGYRHDGGEIYLYRGRFAVTPAADSGKVTLGIYVADEAKRERVERRMIGRFLVRDLIVNKEQVMEGLRGIATRHD